MSTKSTKEERTRQSNSQPPNITTFSGQEPATLSSTTRVEARREQCVYLQHPQQWPHW